MDSLPLWLPTAGLQILLVGWECSSATESLPNVSKALGLIP